jgi:glycerol-3-phosphate dehydrogenase
MAKILVIGGGAMGSAFTIPCLDNKNNVTITEPYSKQFINNLKSKNKFHSVLKIKLPKKLKFRIFGVEVCSAIKNIYAMVIGAGQSLNMSSSLFQKSLIEMKYLTKYFNGKETTVESLAGVGDLYVSAAGGRNSKMGDYLGKGFTFKSAKKKFMFKDTVEGEQLAREIGPFIFKKINLQKIPLMINLLRSLLKNKKLNLNKL